VGTSSASIPAVSFIIAAIMPALPSRENKVVYLPVSDLQFLAVKSQIKAGCNSFPSFMRIIRNYKEVREGAVEWHRVVTGVQHTHGNEAVGIQKG
jgi:hypothetical protein